VFYAVNRTKIPRSLGMYTSHYADWAILAPHRSRNDVALGLNGGCGNAVPSFFFSHLTQDGVGSSPGRFSPRSMKTHGTITEGTGRDPEGVWTQWRTEKSPSLPKIE